MTAAISEQRSRKCFDQSVSDEKTFGVMSLSLQLGLVYLISEVVLTLLRQLRRAGSEVNLRRDRRCLTGAIALISVYERKGNP